jgi:hypothetical protein
MLEPYGWRERQRRRRLIARISAWAMGLLMLAVLAFAWAGKASCTSYGCGHSRCITSAVCGQGCSCMKVGTEPTGTCVSFR